MIAAAERAVGYCADMIYEDFLDDMKTIDACVYNLVVLAEAARGVPEALKEKAADIPWRAIAGFRNRAAHSGLTADLSLDLSMVWSICRNDLPAILPQLREILSRS